MREAISSFDYPYIMARHLLVEMMPYAW